MEKQFLLHFQILGWPVKLYVVIVFVFYFCKKYFLLELFYIVPYIPEDNLLEKVKQNKWKLSDK